MKLYLIIIVLTILCIILSVIYLTSYRALYKQNLHLRLDPLQEKETNREFNHKILAIGSSSIEYWPFEDIGLSKDILFNAGIGGQTSAQVLYRFERLLLIHKPHYLIVQAGLNDIKSVVLLDNSEQVVKDLAANFHRIFELCAENHIVSIYITNFPASKPGVLRRMVWNKTLDELILETNKKIKKICINFNIYIFDAYEVLVEPHSLKRKAEYSKNFLHINEEGYKILNMKLKSELQNIIK
jgi:lysophospholipase L1-like esterase